MSNMHNELADMGDLYNMEKLYDPIASVSVNRG